MKIRPIKNDLSNIKQNDYICDFYASPYSFRTVDAIYKNGNRTMIVIRRSDGRYGLYNALTKTEVIRRFKKVESMDNRLKGLTKCR